MPYAANPPPSPFDLSCIGIMLSMMLPPDMRSPLFDMTAEMAQPDGMRT